MKTAKEEINTTKLPAHVAIIMDGNGRWAKLQGAARVFGHQSGVKSVKETVEAAAELGIKYLTLYAFSTENWNRPGEEVSALMELLVKAIHDETPTLNKNNIRLLAIGALESLPQKCIIQLQKAVQETSKNTGLTLVLALSYSAKWEITEAVKKIASEVQKGSLLPEEITESFFSKQLTTKDIPDPELMIRTSGEHRISNFLLWQLAYAEFYFTDTLWPDFRKEHFYQAIVNYQSRERRFGKTGEQIKNTK
ncbi:MAG: isoprenyl transferase [Bacteroidetes bacterium]|nr:isoprenyl transferase [Bacteroidota bacterium]